jgi:xylulose-5-phosphate/fructose-6-phosphate phosphoketolase
MDEATRHCKTGIGIWEWASNDKDSEPDVIMACAGDVPTLETLAAVKILNVQLPELKIRVINIVDLMTLQPKELHPSGLDDRDYDGLFPAHIPVIFAFHGYPWLIHRLTYQRHNHDDFHVHGFKEEGTTTTPFDMTVLNELDRFHLVKNVVDRVEGLGSKRAYLKQLMRDKLVEHQQYIVENGQDMPAIRNWLWKK